MEDREMTATIPVKEGEAYDIEEMKKAAQVSLDSLATQMELTATEAVLVKEEHGKIIPGFDGPVSLFHFRAEAQ